jgi:hypothetical protein
VIRVNGSRVARMNPHLAMKLPDMGHPISVRDRFVVACAKCGVPRLCPFGASLGMTHLRLTTHLRLHCAMRKRTKTATPQG